jgi:uncharacterized SAM-binding protein YcdF (DUF218 family)
MIGYLWMLLLRVLLLWVLLLWVLLLWVLLPGIIAARILRMVVATHPSYNLQFGSVDKSLKSIGVTSRTRTDDPESLASSAIRRATRHQ